jgi:glycosyltransferase involved in cell wall biosynthesis
MKNVLIIYHYIAHYRVPLYRILSKSDSPKYTICSGLTSEINIKTAEVSLAEIPPAEGGIRWVIIKNWWIYKPFLVQLSVLKLSISRSYDTVIYLGVMYYLTTWLGAILAKVFGKKVIFWTHGFIEEENNLKGIIRSLFYSLADEILVYGQRAKDILISKGFDPKKIKLIYNSLDYDHQVEIRRKYKKQSTPVLFKNSDLPTIGFIGRLTHQKKVIQILEVLKSMYSKNTSANLLIIGDGDQKDVLKAKTIELGLEDFVMFYGPCYEEKTIYQLMKSWNVVVSPGEVGLTAIHALTYGVPVITHDKFSKQMPEYEVIIPDKTGDFFEYENIDSLEQLVSKWLFKKDKMHVEKECYAIIDSYYNPYKQKKIFDTIV